MVALEEGCVWKSACGHRYIDSKQFIARTAWKLSCHALYSINTLSSNCNYTRSSGTCIQLYLPLMAAQQVDQHTLLSLWELRLLYYILYIYQDKYNLSQEKYKKSLTEMYAAYRAPFSLTIHWWFLKGPYLTQHFSAANHAPPPQTALKTCPSPATQIDRQPHCIERWPHFFYLFFFIYTYNMAHEGPRVDINNNI